MTIAPRSRRFRLAAGGLLAVGVASAIVFWVSRPSAPIRLRDVSDRTGISFRHTDGSSGERYLVETASSGMALFDYDGDGWIDVYFLNGAPLGTSRGGEAPANALYRNQGGWQFTDVTATAGVGDTGYGLGVAVGDYDNDGDPDLYLNNHGPNVLYRNNGDGTFTDVTAEAGAADGDKTGAGASFFDADGDGDLDLYVAHYVDFSYAAHVPRTRDGFPVYGGPMRHGPAPDTLFRNEGDGTFTDVSVESGVASRAGTGMGVVAGDFDNDGDTDVVVANDDMENFFFQNDGTGKFTEVGLASGLAYNLAGEDLGNRGVDGADYDNDGWLDLFMTSSQAELPALYRNLGDGAFQDVTLTAGAATRSLPYVGWGAGFVDFDKDGDRDLFLACGHLQDNVERYDGTSAYQVRNILVMNDGRGGFVDVSDRCGDGLAARLSSRGTGFDDLDNDGDVDVVIVNSRQRPTILRNDSPSGNHWLQVRLRGVRANRDGVGARVTVVAGDLEQTDEMHGGRGYQSYHGSRLYFGLGERDHVDRVEVRWIGGGVDVLEDVAVDQLLTVGEGAGASDPAPPATESTQGAD